MSWLFPTPLLIVVAVVAFLFAWPRAAAPVSGQRLLIETFGLTLLATAIVWLVWIVFWLLMTRW